MVLGIASRLLGFYVRGTDDYAGYSMAASAFLALGYTFKHGEHIRVSLLLERLHGGRRRAAGIWRARGVGGLFAAARLVQPCGCPSTRTSSTTCRRATTRPAVDPPARDGGRRGRLLVAILDDLVVTLSGREPARLAKHVAERRDGARVASGPLVTSGSSSCCS